MRRKVPTGNTGIEPRRLITLSLKTDSETETEAQRRADAAWQDLLAGWAAVLATGDKAAAGLVEVAKPRPWARGAREEPRTAKADSNTGRIIRPRWSYGRNG